MAKEYEAITRGLNKVSPSVPASGSFIHVSWNYFSIGDWGIFFSDGQISESEKLCKGKMSYVDAFQNIIACYWVSIIFYIGNNYI